MAQPHEFGDWIGREEKAADVVTPRLAREFEATFSPHLAPVAESCAPLMLHWCLAPAARPQLELGADGHPAKGGFLPPVPLPRRMWAAGEVAFLDDIRIGEAVTRVSRIAAIEHKAGRTGELWFVTVEHDFATPRGVAVRDIQTIVYRAADARAGAAPAPSVAAGPADDTIEMTTTRLFRYSALTFNGHRIHYDHVYATTVEGYAGLVVHGPMQATLLANAAAKVIGRPPSRFRYRGLAPMIGGTRATLRVTRERDEIRCCCVDGDGGMTMEASGH